jgi:hypothetical protein
MYSIVNGSGDNFHGDFWNKTQKHGSKTKTQTSMACLLLQSYRHSLQEFIGFCYSTNEQTASQKCVDRPDIGVNLAKRDGRWQNMYSTVWLCF